MTEENTMDEQTKQRIVDAIKNMSVWVSYKQGDSKNEADFVENIIMQTKQNIINMIKLDM